MLETYLNRGYKYSLAIAEIHAYRKIINLTAPTELRIASMFLNKKKPIIILQEIIKFRKK
ncbi:MAG: hypothetical protein V3575_03030 [Candidatus Absconditabacteria bacterium]